MLWGRRPAAFPGDDRLVSLWCVGCCSHCWFVGVLHHVIQHVHHLFSSVVGVLRCDVLL